MSERVFKCIPLDVSWTIPGTKHDLKAIYRRASRRVGEYDEIVPEVGQDGLPVYDIIGPLPLRRHSDWSAKGYEYVTVVAAPGVEGSGWPVVAGHLRAKGLNPQDYLQHPVHGTWNPKLYLDTAGKIDRAKHSELMALVYKLGSQAVLDVRRSTDPSFTLPPALMGIAAGTPLPSAPVAPTSVTSNTATYAAVDGMLSAPAGSSAEKRIAAQKKASRAKKPKPPAEVPA